MANGLARKDPMNAQGFRTQRAELPEDLWQPLYDRVNYPSAGTTTLSFFSLPKGTSATLITNSVAATRTKSQRDTNLENQNVVPTKMFKFVGISLAYIHVDEDAATNSQDRDKLRNNGYLTFRIVDKDILFLPLIAIPELNPIVSAATTATNTTINSVAGGGGNNVPMYKFPIPITLNPYENFSVNLVFDGTTTTLTNTLDVALILQGYMRRPT